MIFVVLTSASNAQPFGIAEGTPIERLSVIMKIKESIYAVRPSRRHPEFSVLWTIVTPSAGVCHITAWGDSYNDRAGKQVRDRFDKIQQQLESTYGTGAKFDALQDGAVRTAADEWVSAIKRNERKLQMTWNAESGARLKDGITEILLAVRATSDESAFLLLEYKYSNFPQCQREIRDPGSGVL